nr:hypothetical protein [Ichthyobacterium seriolicida]
MSICPLRTFPCAADKALLGLLVVKLSAISDIFNLVSISTLRTFPCAADNTSVASLLFNLDYSWLYFNIGYKVLILVGLTKKQRLYIRPKNEE